MKISSTEMKIGRLPTGSNTSSNKTKAERKLWSMPPIVPAQGTGHAHHRGDAGGRISPLQALHRHPRHPKRFGLQLQRDLVTLQFRPQGQRGDDASAWTTAKPRCVRCSTTRAVKPTYIDFKTTSRGEPE